MHTHPTDTIHESDDDLLAPRRVRAALADISEATLWRMVARGDLPQPVRISPGRVGWRRRDIRAYATRREAVR